MIKALLYSFTVLTILASTPHLNSAEEQNSKGTDAKVPDVRSQFFCGYCHALTYPRVIKKAYNSWKSGKHKDISCKECHYPAHQQDVEIPGHKKIPREEATDPGEKAELEFMQTELEVLSRLITVLNMDEPVVRTKPRLDDRNCTTSRCHPPTGKGKEGEYWTKKINFIDQTRKDKSKRTIPYVHKTHFDKTKRVEGQEMHCATCHQHETEQKHFEVAKEKCFLCHFKNTRLNEGRAKCSLCHEIPTSPLQKQKKEGAGEDEKPITHQSLEEAKVPCASCHLHLFKGDGVVKQEKCLNCHEDEQGIKKEIFNKKLMHENHVAGQNASCFNCHEPIEHKKGEYLDVARNNCQACHPDHHIFQKIMLGGEEHEGIPETPALMNLVNTNCLACHIEDRVVKGEKIARGSGKTCAACHTEKHEAMAKEWKDKTKEELEAAREIEKEALDALAAAKGKLSEEKLKKAMEMYEKGKENMNIVEYGGGVHNKKYSVMLLDSAMNNFEDMIDMISGGEE